MKSEEGIYGQYVYKCGGGCGGDAMGISLYCGDQLRIARRRHAKEELGEEKRNAEELEIKMQETNKMKEDFFPLKSK